MDSTRAHFERLATAWCDWRARHEKLVARARRAYVIWTWVSLIALALALIFVPETRRGFAVFLWMYYALLQLFMLSRTKTLSWAALARFFTVGAVLVGPGIALLGLAVAEGLFGDVSSDSASTWVAGPAEEAAKLLPLALFLLFARHRASGLSLTDYALVGLATGAGFQFAEDAVRRMTTEETLLYQFLTKLFGTGAQYELVALFPGAMERASGAVFAGHHVLTALAALGIGLALRARPRLGRPALAIPAFLLLLVVLDHSLFNATGSIGDPPVPDWLVALHGVCGAGAEVKPLFVLLLALALALDYRALRAVAHRLPALPGSPLGREELEQLEAQAEERAAEAAGTEDRAQRLTLRAQAARQTLAEALGTWLDELWLSGRAAQKGRAEFFTTLRFLRERRALGFALRDGASPQEARGA